ncbi:MAG: aminoacyl-tRNA hydrolase [Bacilli bacterium]|nr:aminoacyl-tRNA hydrolase [Bacilli bacterium]
MRLIVGLGNPGKEYENTRHNIGFNVLNRYLEKNNLKLDKDKFNGLFTKTSINDEDVILLEPQTFMNLSGDSVRKVMDFYKINVDDILVIQDDLDMEVGKIKLKEKSSSGGHNGIKDIEQKLGTNNFKRLKVGISNDKNRDTKDYVLGKFSKEDKEILDKSYDICLNIIDDFFKMNFDLLMGKYNKR